MDTLTKTANQSTSRSNLSPKLNAMFDFIEHEKMTFQGFLEKVNSPKVGLSDREVCFLNFTLNATCDLVRSRGESFGIEYQSGAASVITSYPTLYRAVTEALAPLFDL